MLLSLLTTPLLLLLQCSLTSGATDPIFVVTVTSQAVSGSTETLCAHINEPKEPLSIVVTLRTDKRNLTILQQGSIKKDFYKCVPFKVPVVTEKFVNASVDVVIRGGKTFLNKTTKILINPPHQSSNHIFIQTDKPIYKPGQTIKFRIVSVDSNVLPRNQVFRTVELQDPFSNRIAQWLNRTTRIGILDLSHSISPEATQGYYTINAWDDKNQQVSHSFEMKEYVLPKYEVNINFPSVITVKDKKATLTVCATYTFDKPVLGSVNAKVCVQSYDYKPGFPSKLDVCKKYSMMTDKTGCGSRVINVTEFGLPSGGSFQVNCNMTESRTGITMQGSTSAVFIHDYAYVHFKDTPDTYRPDMIFKGKVVVTTSQSRPMKNEPVIVYALYGGKNVSVTLTTDISGTADFFFNTNDWSEETVQLWAKHKGGKDRPDFEAYRYYPSGSLYVRPFRSKSKSFLKFLDDEHGEHGDRGITTSCNSNAEVKISYTIQASALKPGQTNLDFIYIVLSRANLVQNGRLVEKVNTGNGAEIKGKLTFILANATTLAPYVQVVVYTVLPNGETLANSMDLPIQDCLMTMGFSTPTALPGEKISLNLKANPGSLCSVRAIDQSLLLLRPDVELDATAVSRKLPVDSSSGCSYNTEEPYTCPYPYFPHYGNRNDIYNIFIGVGINIVTNTDVKAPAVYDINANMLKKESHVGDVGPLNMAVLELELGSNVEKLTQIRKSFPETWIWDLIPVGKSGSVNIAKTVPDSITKWAVGAFCTSSVGFRVASKTDLTVFKPFFVSLALPYSIMREDTFILKATVFNYLPKCIMVKVTLSNSSQFTAQPCKGCTYTQCVCSEESKIFRWIVTPSELGNVSITVRAEAVKSQELCDNEVVTLPDRGRVDTVVHSVLVKMPLLRG